jgi:hypothetical protein
VSNHRRNQLLLAEEFGTTPLRHLMQRMCNDDLDEELRMQAAIAAAPYVHPRLKQIEVAVDLGERSVAEIDREMEYLLRSGAIDGVFDRTQGFVAEAERDLIGITQGEAETP